MKRRGVGKKGRGSSGWQAWKGVGSISCKIKSALKCDEQAVTSLLDPFNSHAASADFQNTHVR